MLDFEVQVARATLRYAAECYHEARAQLGLWAGSVSQGFAMTRLNHCRNYYREKMIALHELLFARHLTNVPPKGWKTWAFDEELGYRVKTG